MQEGHYHKQWSIGAQAEEGQWEDPVDWEGTRLLCSGLGLDKATCDMVCALGCVQGILP